MENERDIVYSQAVKAGKRIYYLDVKRSRRDELYLSITESKKIVSGDGPESSFTFEKHKIFLYQEDFSKFIGALSQAIGYIHENQPAGDHPITSEEDADDSISTLDEEKSPLDGELDIQIEFD